MVLDVRLHAFLGIEGVVADGALVDLLAVVGDLVELEDVVVAEGFAADLAGIRFFAGVGPGVHLERKKSNCYFVLSSIVCYVNGNAPLECVTRRESLTEDFWRIKTSSHKEITTIFDRDLAKSKIGTSATKIDNDK